MNDTNLDYYPPDELDYVGNGLTWEEVMADSTYVNTRFMRNWPLTSQEKQIVKNVYVKGMTQQKTAEKLKISQPAVSQKLTVIKSKLREL